MTGGAGSAIKVGIRANDTTNGANGNKPSGAPLIADNTGVATTANNTTLTLCTGGTLGPGVYWMGVKATGTLPTMYCLQNSELGGLTGLDATVDVLTATRLTALAGWSIASR
jgi:hypothetical protein